MIVIENGPNVTKQPTSKRIIPNAYCSLYLISHSPQFIRIAWNTNRIGNNKISTASPKNARRIKIQTTTMPKRIFF